MVDKSKFEKMCLELGGIYSYDKEKGIHACRIKGRLNLIVKVEAKDKEIQPVVSWVVAGDKSSTERIPVDRVTAYNPSFIGLGKEDKALQILVPDDMGVELVYFRYNNMDVLEVHPSKKK